MLLGGRTPGSAGVVHQDVDFAEFLQDFRGTRREPPVTSATRPDRSSKVFTPIQTNRSTNARMTTLVMFSGGLDSTAMLVKLLGESADELRVHHIRMMNREKRDLAEQRAVNSIVAYCRARYRPFRYCESALDFRDLDAIPIDYLSIAFVACQGAIDTPGCTRIA